MNSLFLILIILFGGAVLAYLANKISPIISSVVSFVTITTATVLFFTQLDTETFIQFQIGGIDLQWGIDSYTSFFGIIVLGLGVLASMFSIQYMQGKDRLGYFNFNFVLSILGMVGIIFSQDFVSFFIFWEIMTWSSYLIVIYNGNKVKSIGVKYMIFSAIGAYAMLAAIVSIKGTYGTFIISEAIANGALSDNIYIPVMLLIGFAVKAATMPMHVWAAGAYSNAPMSFTAVFSGALSKMGILGMGIVLAALYHNSDISMMFSIVLVKNVLMWLGAITAAIATLYAIIQTDAKKLLAYSSIAQLGYITIGLASGTKMGVMAALFLAVIHGVFKGALFMVVGAVERQVGTTDMTKISGLIRKMPWTFLVALMSIIALAGVPPLAGFVGKWMLYEALITESNSYFLVVVVFFASTAGFLYSYRFLFGLFLGQEEEDTAHVKEAPASMVVPMMFLAMILFVVGAFPGLLIDPIAQAMGVMGYTDVNYGMSTLSNVWGNELNMQSIGISVGVVFAATFAFLSLKGRKGTKNVGTKDISTSGEIPYEHENMTYQMDFFKPFERAAAPLYKRSMDKIWNQLGAGMEALFDFVRKINTGNGQTYAIYIIVFLVLMLILKDTLFVN